MRAINRRVQHLERARTARVGDRIRYVLTIAGTDLEVSASAVENVPNDDGTIKQIVTLAGSRQDNTNDDLDPFANRFRDPSHPSRAQPE
jgi:hypothetical protein